MEPNEAKALAYELLASARTFEGKPGWFLGPEHVAWLKRAEEACKAVVKTQDKRLILAFFRLCIAHLSLPFRMEKMPSFMGFGDVFRDDEAFRKMQPSDIHEVMYEVFPQARDEAARAPVPA